MADGLGLHFSDYSIDAVVPGKRNNAQIKLSKGFQLVFEPRSGPTFGLLCVLEQPEHNTEGQKKEEEPKRRGRKPSDLSDFSWEEKGGKREGVLCRDVSVEKEEPCCLYE